LRWRLRDETALDQQTMEICLHEIARCKQTGIKPDFIAVARHNCDLQLNRVYYTE
jgi:hypothetical protein